MICPKCGFEQPDSPECMRCGVIVSRYKGPVLAAAPRPASPAPTAPAPPGHQTVRISFPPPVAPVDSGNTLYGDPAPAMAAAAGGTLYEGPTLAPAGGGTVYGDPVSPALRGRVRPVVGTFEVGKVLSESFSIYFSNFIPFALLTALALSPLYLAQAYLGTIENSSPASIATPQGLAPLLMALASAFVCPYIATSAITFGVFQQMRGKDTSIGDCLGRGLAMVLPVLMLALVQGVAILIGFALCIVPGLLLTLRWAVSVPAAVEERPGISGAMSRSTYLTEGFRGEVFGILFVIGILNFGAQFLVLMTATKNATLFLILSGTKDLLLVGLSATATAVMYYRLRSVKESIDVDQIASVFA